MTNKTQELMKFLEEEKLNFFSVYSEGDTDYLKHTEVVNGITIDSTIILSDNQRTEIYYDFAQCNNTLKYEALLSYLNELNYSKAAKYYINKQGIITAAFFYFSDDDTFNPRTLLTLYVGFLNNLTRGNEVSKIMKIIWG